MDSGWRTACAVALAAVSWSSVPRAVSAQLAPQQGAYVVRQAGREIAREEYTFDGRVLRTTLELPLQGLVVTSETEYDTAGVPLRYGSETRGSGSPDARRLTVVFGRTADWSITGPDGANATGGSLPLPQPYAVFRNLAFSDLAVALQRYDRDRGGVQELALFVPGPNQVITGGVVLAGDTGTVTLASVSVTVALDDGWLVSATVPAQAVTVEREEPGAPAREPADGSAAPPAGVSEEIVRFSSGEVSLEGTLATGVARGAPAPVALIIAGSGPTDRDGNSPLAVRSDMYKQLAWALAAEGIASLRYDKRVLPTARGPVDLADLTFEDFVADVGAAARFLSADDRFGPVVLVGHSLGGSLAIEAAAAGAPVAGIALLAAPGRRFVTVLRTQLSRQLDSATMTIFDTAMVRFLTGDTVPPIPPTLRPFFVPLNRRFIQTLAAHDPVAVLRALDLPVLIVQGGMDIQIDLEDAERLAEARPDARAVIVADANHVFKRAQSRDRGAQLPMYLDPSLPLVPELAGALADWVRQLP